MTVSRSLRRAFSILAAAIVALTAAHSHVRRVPIDEETVRVFIGSFHHVKKKSEEFAADYGDETIAGDAGALAEGWLVMDDARADLDRTARAYGFDGFAGWIEVLSSIAGAYVFAATEGDPDARLTEMAQRFRDEPEMSAADKALMLDHISGTTGRLAAIVPPQASIDAVARHLDALAVLFEEKVSAFA